MYPHQQGQSGYPQQQSQFYHNVGFNNFAPQTFGTPNPTPGFNLGGYPSANTGYPAPSTQSQGYPSMPSTGGVPYPTQNHNTASGYPPNPAYPTVNSVSSHQSTGYPAQNSGYPAQNTGYPAQNTGYPAQNTDYPAQTTGYPSSNPGYPAGPPSHSAYPSAHGGYPNQSPHTGTIAGTLGLTNRSRPTVVAANPFNPRADAEALRKAMKGFGTDEKTIIKILTKRTNEQRLRIAFEFKTLYGKDLVSDLKSEVSGNFEDLLVAMMTPLPQFYAKELHDAISGIGTDEDVLIEVMCTLSNHEIDVIKKAYTAMYGSLLEDDLRGDTSGHFKRLMTSLCVGNRSEDFTVNQAKVREDAKSLLRAGEMRMGTDESVFNAVLCGCSYPHLNAVFKEYQEITGHDIDDAIKGEFSGDLEKAHRAIVKVVRNKPAFFAEVLYKSMKGLGTNDRQLIRVMVTRSEVDLQDIADVFQANYGKSLQSFIEGDCSGHYKKCLLGLLGAY